LVEEYALSSGPSEVAQLSQILSEIGAAAGDSGASLPPILAALKSSSCATAAAIDAGSIRANLIAYYASVGASVRIPPFELWISETAVSCPDGGPIDGSAATDDGGDATVEDASAADSGPDSAHDSGSDAPEVGPWPVCDGAPQSTPDAGTSIVKLA